MKVDSVPRIGISLNSRSSIGYINGIDFDESMIVIGYV
jgi:hypothetical protein